jgi:hypothetical protein|tara:strand:+ start:1486 stop:1695 length:210 start_codon:yes stop_codon:yes gene_type:complete
MFPIYMQHYEIVYLAIFSAMAIYLNIVSDGRWGLTLRILNTVLIFQWLFFGYLYLSIEGNETIYDVLGN